MTPVTLTCPLHQQTMTACAPNTMSIVLSPRHLIENEILSVTSVMRKNARWASSSRIRSTRDATLASTMGLRKGHSFNSGRGKEPEDVDLMLGFEGLKKEIRLAQGEPKTPA